MELSQIKLGLLIATMLHNFDPINYVITMTGFQVQENWFNFKHEWPQN
jgi:hypothetical protein